MNKKDKLFIGICLIITLIGVGIYMFISKNQHAQMGVVEYKEEVLLTFDLDEDKTYTFSGSYGEMHLEVKDRQFRVIDVECPNHNCEQMGWQNEESLTPIVCLPNEVIIYAKAN